jgi:AraC-like DNA-binding protein
VGSNIRGGQPSSGIRFDAAVLARPMATADRMLERLMRHYGDLQLSALPVAASGIDQLRREVANLVLRGEITVTRLARSLGMSSRTLQRRLSGAGVTYTELVNDVRRTLALNLMQNPGIALGEIAFSLGYSEISAFNHAFRRWFGCSPGEYRSRTRAVARLDG